jgi:RNA polymerase sigma-70 factor (ECF subfamily)
VSLGGLRVLPGGRSARPESPGLPEGVLAELYEKYAAAVYARCRYLLRDDAEAREALEDVFVEVLESLPRFCAQASPATWMQRIATRHCLNLLRSGRAAKWRGEVAQLAIDRTPSFEPPDKRALVRALLSSAPEEAREIAVLYFVDELSQAEIAELLGCSLPSVATRLREFLACSRGAFREAVPGLRVPGRDEP